MKLNRSLYGLRQSPRVFNKLLVSKVLEYGLEKFGADPCVFRLFDSEKKSVTLIVGVYGMISSSRDFSCLVRL